MADTFVNKNIIDSKLNQLKTRSYLYEGLVYQNFLRLIVELSNSSIGYFHLYNEDDCTIRLAVWSDGVLPMCTTNHVTHYPLKEAGIWADSVRLRSPVVHNDYAKQATSGGLPEGHFPLTRHLSIPIFVQDKICAIVGVGNSLQEYSDQLLKDLDQFAQQGYQIVLEKIEDIENRRKNRLELAVKDSISVLVNMVSCLTGAIALRDEYTAHHSQNVADLCVGISQQMGLGDNTILGLKLGSLVHDIGKIAIPAEILTKPGRLHHAEYDLIKTHVERGAELFSSITFPWSIPEMILQHHERLNGTGYPQGLRSESIILEARIIAVADVFDSMSCNRPYRKAPGMERAIAELQTGRGTLYDPYVVDALLRFLEKVDEDFWVQHQYHKIYPNR